MLEVRRNTRLVLCLLALSGMMFGQSGSKKKVLVNVRPEMVKEFAALSPNLDIAPVRQADLANQIADADALVGLNITPDLLRMAKKLQWIQTGNTGVERVLFPELIDHPLVLTNQKHVYGPQIADHALAFLLALTAV